MNTQSFSLRDNIRRNLWGGDTKNLRTEIDKFTMWKAIYALSIALVAI